MDAEVEAWLSEVVLPDFGPRVAYDETARVWFRALHASAGPLTGEALWGAAVTHQFELAKDAVLAVYADLSATLTDRSLIIAPELQDYVVRISCEGKFSEHDGGRMLAFGPDEALLEVARTVQDMLTALWIVWPECPGHGRALMAEARHKPIWICRNGPHEIAPIGSLGVG